MNLREWLKVNRYTVSAFSKLINVNRPYIHDWMSGKRRPSKTILMILRSVTRGKVKTYDDLIDEGRETPQ